MFWSELKSGVLSRDYGPVPNGTIHVHSRVPPLWPLCTLQNKDRLRQAPRQTSTYSQSGKVALGHKSMDFGFRVRFGTGPMPSHTHPVALLLGLCNQNGIMYGTKLVASKAISKTLTFLQLNFGCLSLILKSPLSA